MITIIIIIIIWSIVGFFKIIDDINNYTLPKVEDSPRYYIIGGPLTWIAGVGLLLCHLMDKNK